MTTGGRYERAERDADDEVREESINKHGWSDGESTVSHHTEYTFVFTLGKHNKFKLIAFKPDYGKLDKSKDEVSVRFENYEAFIDDCQVGRQQVDEGTSSPQPTWERRCQTCLRQATWDILLRPRLSRSTFESSAWLHQPTEDSRRCARPGDWSLIILHRLCNCSSIYDPFGATTCDTNGRYDWHSCPHGQGLRRA